MYICIYVHVYTCVCVIQICEILEVDGLTRMSWHHIRMLFYMYWFATMPCMKNIERQKNTLNLHMGLLFGHLFSVLWPMLMKWLILLPSITNQACNAQFLQIWKGENIFSATWTTSINDCWCFEESRMKWFYTSFCFIIIDNQWNVYLKWTIRSLRNDKKHYLLNISKFSNVTRMPVE